MPVMPVCVVEMVPSASMGSRGVARHLVAVTSGCKPRPTPPGGLSGRLPYIPMWHDWGGPTILDCHVA